jgi:hypothetical protein
MFVFWTNIWVWIYFTFFVRNGKSTKTWRANDWFTKYRPLKIQINQRFNYWRIEVVGKPPSFLSVHNLLQIIILKDLEEDFQWNVTFFIAIRLCFWREKWSLSSSRNLEWMNIIQDGWLISYRCKNW